MILLGLVAWVLDAIPVAVLIALGLVGFSTVAWVSSRPPAAEAAGAAAMPSQTLVVISAARVIHAGSLLRSEDLGSTEVPRAEVGPGTMLDTPQVRRELSGAMDRRGFSAGDLVRPADVMHPSDHGFLAAVLMPGMRALTVDVEAITGTAGLIWPGDRVDLILTQVMPDNAAPLGRRVFAETVLTDVRVIAIDQQLVQGASPGGSEQTARTVTLEVNSDQAERVSVAMRLGRLSLAVRSADVAHEPPGPRMWTGTVWASDVSAALGHDATTNADHSVHVFPGVADSKEFHF